MVKQNFNKQYSYCTEKGKKLQENGRWERERERENSVLRSNAEVVSEIERREGKEITWRMATETMKRSMRDKVA